MVAELDIVYHNVRFIRYNHKERSMTKIEADERFGPIVYQTPKSVVRARHSDMATTVYIHHLINDVEQLPLGYMLGDNIATFEVKK